MTTPSTKCWISRAATCGVFTTVLGCSASSSVGDVKIGLLLPFTGDGAAVGENLEVAARMVVDDVNASGGVRSPTTGNDGRLELVTLDTHSDTEQGLDAVQQMIDEGVIAIVGPERSELALAMLPILEENEIVFLSPVVSSGTQPRLDVYNSWYRFAPSTSVTGRAMAYDVLGRGVDRLALMYTRDDYHSAIAAEVADRYEREGGTLVVSIPLPSGRPSFSDQVINLFQNDFEGLALVAPPKAAAQVVNEVSFLGNGRPQTYFFPPSLETQVFVENTSAAALEGARGITAGVPDFDEAFPARFEERSGDVPLSGAYFYYDAMMVLSLAITTAYHFEWVSDIGARVREIEPLDRPRDEFSYIDLLGFTRFVSRRDGIRTTWDELDEALSTLKRDGELVFYQGLTGTMVQNEDGQRNAAATTVWTIRDGRIELVEGESSP